MTCNKIVDRNSVLTRIPSNSGHSDCGGAVIRFKKYVTDSHGDEYVIKFHIFGTYMSVDVTSEYGPRKSYPMTIDFSTCEYRIDKIIDELYRRIKYLSSFGINITREMLIDGKYTPFLVISKINNDHCVIYTHFDFDEQINFTSMMSIIDTSFRDVCSGDIMYIQNEL